MSESIFEHLQQGSVNCSQCKVRELVLFSRLEQEHFELIHQPIHDVKCSQGSHLFTTEETADHIYTLRNGMVKLEQLVKQEKVRVVRLLVPGDVVGLEALVSDQYRYKATAILPSSFCQIPTPVIDKLRANSPELCEELMLRWDKALASADRWLAKLNAGDSKERVTNLVRYLLEHSHIAPEIFMPNGEDIASITGLSKETVSRIIANMKRDSQLVALGAGTYEVYLP
jgi:CRP/FNR family transcriptional regulator